jgi:hypothetical protein
MLRRAAIFRIEELGARNSDAMDREVCRLLHGCEDREGAIGGTCRVAGFLCAQPEKQGEVPRTDMEGSKEVVLEPTPMPAAVGSFCRGVRLGASREEDKQALAAAV